MAVAKISPVVGSEIKISPRRDPVSKVARRTSSSAIRWIKMSRVKTKSPPLCPGR